VRALDGIASKETREEGISSLGCELKDYESQSDTDMYNMRLDQYLWHHMSGTSDCDEGDAIVNRLEATSLWTFVIGIVPESSQSEERG